MITPSQVFDLLNKEFPFETQESWDNSGLLVYSGVESDSVLVCLDVTADVVEKAVEMDAKIIVSHHPVIFSGLKEIYSGDVVYSLIKNDISVISAHTNFDKYRYGTCFDIANRLGLDIVPDDSFDFGVIAETDGISVQELGWKCKSVFGSASVTMPHNRINTVFICAGSGSDMKNEVIESGADCYLCGECKYHDMLDLAAEGISVVTLGHDNSEKLSVETIANLIKENFEDTDVQVYIPESLVQNI
ncbi:MAG: Nif3-like dinuclear metal center hexameric protein [Oscillospiraceae bacterium]|nr:Nif3-like dinuclear metal center hexameric protein [Oscillospiraceae bacterium]